MNKHITHDTGNAKRYHHKKLNGAEFERLRRSSKVSIRDFMFMSGRHSRTVASFRGDIEGAESPVMSDVMLLELVKRHPETYDMMMDIANEYSLGPTFVKGE